MDKEWIWQAAEKTLVLFTDSIIQCKWLLRGVDHG